MEEQIGSYIKANREGIFLKVEEVLAEIQNAKQLAVRCCEVLGIKEQNPSQEDIFLPYHGPGHAKNTLSVGMKMFLAAMGEVFRKKGEQGKNEQDLANEQRYWVRAAAITLALHELDDWWVLVAENKGRSDKVEAVKKLVMDAIEGEISPADFNAFIMLDSFSHSVEQRLQLARDDQQRKKFLPEDGGFSDFVKGDLEMLKILGEIVVAADFLQVSNSSYRRKMILKDKKGKFEVMLGPLVLALEMYIVRPEFIPKGWQKMDEEGRVVLDLRKVGSEEWFLQKVREKIGDLRYLEQFNEQEAKRARGAVNNFEQMAIEMRQTRQ